MQENKFVIYVDTSYLKGMSTAEKADWNRLLEHAKACISNLDTKPILEIHIPEIALSEYRGNMVDTLKAKIERTNTQIKALRNEWERNDIAKEIDYPLPRDEDIFPGEEKINEIADRFIEKLLNGGIKKINTEAHHKDAIWKKYFNWECPFNIWSISQRDDDKVREKRRSHIPDAWILEGAIDAKKNGSKMICLCKDKNLSAALMECGHVVFEVADSALKELFPPAQVEPALAEIPEINQGERHPTVLDDLLSQAPNNNAKNIYLRLLGFVVPLDTPTHDTLIDFVVSKGFDHKLTEACAIILSDRSKPYIIDTGSHYIAGDKEICAAAADRLTLEIIDMLERVQ